MLLSLVGVVGASPLPGGFLLATSALLVNQPPKVILYRGRPSLASKQVDRTFSGLSLNCENPGPYIMV